jgi:hypothetical protein
MKNLFKLHFEITKHFIGFIVSFYIRKMNEKYVLNWLVVQNFQNIFS